MKLDQDLVDKIYKVVLGRAGTYDPIYYGDLYKQFGLNHENPGDRAMGRQLLATINERDKDHLITSFVVSKGGNGPSEGFYALAEEWGRIKPGLSDAEKLNFWIAEMKSVHSKYRKI